MLWKSIPMRALTISYWRLDFVPSTIRRWQVNMSRTQSSALAVATMKRSPPWPRGSTAWVAPTKLYRCCRWIARYRARIFICDTLMLSPHSSVGIR